MLKLIANDGKLIPGVMLSELGEASPSLAPDANIVSQLDEALALAKSGEIEALGLVFVAKFDGCAYIRAAGDRSCHALLAGLADIHYELLKLRHDDSEDETSDVGA